MTDVLYLDGWHDQEHDGVQPFRWMSGAARCQLTHPQGATHWLRITAGQNFEAAGPRLSVSADGAPIGNCHTRRGCFSYLFPLPDRPTLELTLAVDRTFRAPGDARELGLFVRAIEIIDLSQLDAPLDGEGWHEWEHDGYFPCRWMASEARLLVPGQLVSATRFGMLPVYSGFEDASQVLSITADDDTRIELPLAAGWHLYDLQLPAAPAARGSGPLQLTFRVNRVLPADAHPADQRELGAAVGRLDLHSDPRRHEKLRRFSAVGASRGAAPPVEGDQMRRRLVPDGADGLYEWELWDLVPFRWMQPEARVSVAGDLRGTARFCSIPIFSDYEDLSQVLTVHLDGRFAAELPLVGSWTRYSFALPDPACGDVEFVFRVNKEAQRPTGDGDHRTRLAVRVGPFEFHDDPMRHEAAVRFHENAVRNRREYAAGAIELTSYPLSLGIDLYAKCNIKPPCVYCTWDHAKASEGDNLDAVVDDRTLVGYGRFFDSARSLVNCSFGEPLLHPGFAAVLELLSRYDKEAEISTNGQAFTPENVQALAGARVTLYVSLDAASAETYARLRNDRWWDAIAGLLLLSEVRRHNNWLPRVNMVFMPMRTNVADLEGYFRLCRDVHADAVVLRPLVPLEEQNFHADRGDYHFDYARECLTRDERVALVARCEEYSVHYRIPVVNQFEFGTIAGRGGE